MHGMPQPALRAFPSLASSSRSRRLPRNPLQADFFVAEAPKRRKFHFPGACRLPDGTILVVARLGKEHVSPSGVLQLVRSTDDGATWSEPWTVWDSDHDDRDPMLSVGPTGTVHLIFFTRPEPQLGDIEAAGVRVMSSDDGGYHWTMPVRLESRRRGWMASHGQVMETPDGVLIAPVYGHGWSGIIRSTDDGASFPASLHHVFDTGAVATNEVTLTMSGGTLMAWLRPVQEGTPSLLFRSHDDGETWEGPERTGIMQSSASVQPLADGRLLLAWGDRSGRFGERRVTCLAIVEKPLDPWTDVTPVPVWDALNNDQGNPALTLTADANPLVIVNDYASRQLVGFTVPLQSVEDAPVDDDQLAGSLDLLAMARAGDVTVETSSGCDAPAQRLFDRRLGLGSALFAADGQQELRVTLRFRVSVRARDVGVALRPGEWQDADVEITTADGSWRTIGRLEHGWRFGDVDWLALNPDDDLTAVRVTTRSNPAKRPRYAGDENPTLAISQVALR